MKVTSYCYYITYCAYILVNYKQKFSSFLVFLYSSYHDIHAYCNCLCYELSIVKVMNEKQTFVSILLKSSI